MSGIGMQALANTTATNKDEMRRAFAPYEVDTSTPRSLQTNVSGPTRRRTKSAPKPRLYTYTKSLVVISHSTAQTISTRDANIELRGQLNFASTDDENKLKTKVNHIPQKLP